MTPVQWSPGMSLATTEKLIIKNAYRFYAQNKTATSRSLGIAIRTLENKLDKYAKEDLIEEKRQQDDKQKRHDELARFRGQQKASANGNDAKGGVYMEPTTEDSPQPVLPVSERKEVQSVLPTAIANGSAGSNS